MDIPQEVNHKPNSSAVKSLTAILGDDFESHEEFPEDCRYLWLKSVNQNNT